MKDKKRSKYQLLHVEGHIKSVQGMCADELRHVLVWNELQRVLSGLRRTKAYQSELAAHKGKD